MKKFLLFLLAWIGIYSTFVFVFKESKGKYKKIVINFKNDISENQQNKILKDISKKYNVKIKLNSKFSKKEKIYIVKGKKELIENLKKSSLFKNSDFIEPNFEYNKFEVVNDPMFKKQWNLKIINIEQAWKRSQGKGVIVAVIDTGVSKVADLKQTEFVKGYDFVNDKVNADDDNGHGTHVAGTIAQSTNNGFGVAGVAPKVKIMPLKVLDAYGTGETSDIAEAIRFAADNNADIINMSLGGFGDSRILREAVNYAYKKGVVIIAAAGNEKTNASSYPARYKNVISVSSFGQDKNKAPYSNYGLGVNISAPGGNLALGQAGGILQHTINKQTKKEEFLSFQGTSMAAPHVAGVAALIKSMGVKNPHEIRMILEKSAVKIQDIDNHFGAGFLNAQKAVEMASSGKSLSKVESKVDKELIFDRVWINKRAYPIKYKIAVLIFAFILFFYLKQKHKVKNTFGAVWGVILGSSGLFLLKGVHLLGVPNWMINLAGTSLPELGNIFFGTHGIHPITGNFLFPLLIVGVLLGSRLRWFAIGVMIGYVGAFIGATLFASYIVWIGAGVFAKVFLMLNAAFCFGITHLSIKSAEDKI